MIAVNELGRRIGEDHHRAILSDASIDLIRELHENHGKSYSWLATCFDVPKVTIQKVCQYVIRAQTVHGYRQAKKPLPERKLI